MAVARVFYCLLHNGAGIKRCCNKAQETGYIETVEEDTTSST